MSEPLSRRELVKRGGMIAGAAAVGSPLLTGTASAATAIAASGKPAQLDDFSHLKGKKVGHVVIDISATFPTRSAAEAKRLAHKHGFHVEVVDGAGDYNKINQALTTWATQKVAAVFNTGCEPSLLKSGLAATTAAKVPVGCVVAGYGPGVKFDVEADDWISYARLGTYIFTRLGMSGYGAAILDWPNVPALRIRAAQIEAMFKYANIPVLANEILQDPGFVADAKQKTTALLTKYPKGSKLKVIVGGWDDVGVACAQAVLEAGRKDVFVVSADGDLSAYALMRNNIDWPFGATCASDVETMTDIMYGQMSALVGGAKKPLATTLYVDAPMITGHNLPPKGQYAHGQGLQLYYY